MIDWKRFADKDTIVLIEHIKKRHIKTHFDEAQAAFHAFCFRFTNLLTKESEIICKKWGLHNEDAIEIVHRTFKRFWKYCESFTISKSTSSNYDIAIIKYLNKIARRVRIDYYHEKLGINISPYSGTEKIISEFPNGIDISSVNNIINPKRHEDIVKLALSKLSDKHKIIYLNYSAYQYNGYKMPRKLLAEMREKLNLKQATIQAYKKETIDKINEYLILHELK